MIYLLLFLEFFKIGLFTFGGGYAMIPLVKETVLQHQWLEETELYDLIGVCESTPGPIAINMATFIGATNGGFFGSIVATFGVVLPSFLIIFILAKFLSHFLENRHVKSALEGIRPTIISLILTTGLLMIRDLIDIRFSPNFQFDFTSLLIFLLLIFILHLYKKETKKDLKALPLILISAILGIFVCSLSL